MTMVQGAPTSIGADPSSHHQQLVPQTRMRERSLGNISLDVRETKENFEARQTEQLSSMLCILCLKYPLTLLKVRPCHC